MNKFKAGDKVRIVTVICNTADKGDIVTVTAVNDVTGVHFKTNTGKACFHLADNFEPIGDTMHVGDILETSEGRTRKILVCLNQGVEVYLLSPWDGYEYATAWFTAAEIEENGWKLKTTPEVPEVTEKTVAELEAALKLPTGSLRIKKEA